MLSLRAQPWNKQYMAHVQHSAAVCDGSQVFKGPWTTFLQRSWADRASPPTSSFFYRASLRTGCEPHWPGDALRHLGSETQAGPGTAAYCVRWPSPSKVWFHRMALGQLFGSWKKGPRASHCSSLASICYILPIVIHMIAAGRSLLLRSSLSGSSLVCFFPPWPYCPWPLLLRQSASSGSSQPSWASHRVSRERKYCSHPSPEASSQLCRELIYRTGSLDCRATLNRLSRFTPASYSVVPTPVDMVDPVPIISVAWVRSGRPARLTPSTGPCRRPRRALRWPLCESLPSGNVGAVLARPVSHRPTVRERGVRGEICCVW